MNGELPPSESLTVEFKSDVKQLSVDALVLAVVCLANGIGGTLYLGVEDDGTVTGLNPGRQQLVGLTAQIAQRTHPTQVIAVETHAVNGQSIAVLTVPRSDRPVATAKGRLVRRALDHKGRPECVPFFPDEFTSHQSQLGRLDPSRGVWPGSTLDDLDPVARAELQRLIASNPRSDKSLLGLDDADLDAALHVVEIDGDGLSRPNLTGLLLIGKEESLARLVPNHEVAFQVLAGTEVRINQIRRSPLVRLLPLLEQSVEVRNDETELDLGLFRIGVPRVDPDAFREALVNAVSHRDYHRMGAVHVQWRDVELEISSPGGLMEGVRVDRLLTTPPTPRNPNLTDALKRIGLAERTGRGVDRIYRGLVRYGRPVPDWSETDSSRVVVSVRTDGHDTELLRWVVVEERQHGELPVETLLVLAALKEQGPLKLVALYDVLQRNDSACRRILTALTERGLLVTRGQTRAREFLLAPRIFADLSETTGHVRHAGLNAIYGEALVVQLAEQSTHGIRRADVVKLLGLEPQKATRLLGKLVNEGRLRKTGQRRGTTYSAARIGHKE